MAYYASQCFPARNLLRYKQNSDGGAWLVAYREEQNRRFDAVLCPDAKTEQRRKAQRKKISTSGSYSNNSFKNETFVALNGIFLLKHANVDNPSDLAYLNISGKGLAVSNYEDFVLFDNVIHIEANENSLSLETFRTFPALRELELQLNNIRDICINSEDFKFLEFLDLSFNSLTEQDVLEIGMLPSLRCLYLSGNGLKHLPVEMAHRPNATESEDEISTGRSRFESLEVLYLDENEFEETSIFACLAALKRLRVLSLSKNNLRSLPHLRPLAPTSQKSHLIPCGKTNLTSSDELFDFEVQQLTNVTDFQEELMDLSRDPKEPSDELADLPKEVTEVPRELQTGPNERGASTDFTEYFQETNHIDVATDQQVAPGNGESDLKVEQQDVDALLGFDTDLEIPGGKSDIKLEKTLVAGDSNFDSTDLDLPKDIPEFPFENLEMLDISYNQIADEHALLPLTAWPSLLQVNVWENPVTKNCKGMPPLLDHHLTKLCGIQINRNEPKKTHKPAVGPKIAPVVRHNKVDDVLPPMRRKNQLMLEFESYEAALKNGSLYRDPLPPITPTSEKHKDFRDSHSAPAQPKASKEAPPHDSGMNRPHSVAADQFFGPPGTGDEQDTALKAGLPSNGSSDALHSADGVFLTQVDVNDEPEDEEGPFEEALPELHVPEQEAATDESTTKEQTASEKPYDVYEDLLRIEGAAEDIDTPPVEDLRGNIKALKNALSHPLVFNEPSTKEQEKQTYTRRSQGSQKKSAIKTKRDKVNTALEKIRTRNDAVEENLDTVLQNYDNDPATRKKFPEVKTLLKEVQAKYNDVRQASLETATTAHVILHGKNKHEDALKHAPRGQKPLLGHPEGAFKFTSGNATESRGRSKGFSSYPQDTSKELEGFKERVAKRI